jgi:hypothetical protein
MRYADQFARTEPHEGSRCGVGAAHQGRARRDRRHPRRARRRRHEHATDPELPTLAPRHPVRVERLPSARRHGTLSSACGALCLECNRARCRVLHHHKLPPPPPIEATADEPVFHRNYGVLPRLNLGTPEYLTWHACTSKRTLSGLVFRPTNRASRSDEASIKVGERVPGGCRSPALVSTFHKQIAWRLLTSDLRESAGLKYATELPRVRHVPQRRGPGGRPC